jgi:hypothetical protein
LGVFACAGGAGADVDVVVSFQLSDNDDNRWLEDEWESFREKFAASAHVVVTGGDFAPVYQAFKIPTGLPDLVDAGSGRDGGHGAEMYGYTVSVPVKVRVPQGDGRSFGVELAGRDGAPSFGGRTDGVSVHDGMRPVVITLRPYISLSGSVWSVTDILENRFDEMMTGEIGAYLFAEQETGKSGPAEYEIVKVAAGSVADNATFSKLVTPYSNEVFTKDGESITYASVFLHVESENNFVGFCVPGTTEYPGRGLEPGAKLELDLYMAARDTIGAGSAALLSCLSPRVVATESGQGGVPTLYLSFVTTNEPSYVAALLRGPPEFEGIFDDRPEEGGGLVIPGLDVGFVKDIEPELYMGFRMLDLYPLASQFPDGAEFKLKLEIGFGSDKYTTNELVFRLQKPSASTSDGGTDASAEAPDAAADASLEGRDAGP